MRGHIRKRATWQITVDFGMQPLQRCPACRKRYWTRDGRLPGCPKCGGLLEEDLARLGGTFIPIMPLSDDIR